MISDAFLQDLVDKKAVPLLSDSRQMAKELIEARQRIRDLEQEAADANFERELAGGCDG